MKRVLAAFLIGAVFLSPVNAAADDERAGWYRIEFADRITSADRAALEAIGGESLLYVPHNSYLLWLEREALAQSRAIPTVQAARAVLPTEKLILSPAFAGSVPVTAFLHGERRADVEDALSGLGEIGPVTALANDGPLWEAMLLVDSGNLSRLAERPEVLSVGPAMTGIYPDDEGTAQIIAGNIGVPSNRPIPGYESWLNGVGLDGSGVMVAITDTGIDATHPDLEGRVEKPEDYSALPSGEPVDSYGHGTHVAGIVAGDGALFRAQGGSRDFSGFLYGLGVAPGATLLDQNVIGTTSPATVTSDWPPQDSFGFAHMTRDALLAGAAIWNASWNTGEGDGYLASARMIDTLVRDGDLLTPFAEPFTMVFSAGNSGSSMATITSPKEAKNIITVASTRSQRFTKVSGSEGREDVDLVSSFSSRGPASDGRILPTIAAPGENVASTRSSAATAACFEPPSDGNSYGSYAMCSGTSMSSPHVAGAVALITQWWREANNGADPSPAMTKALLINSAYDMGAPDIPNNNEGWGRVHLGNLFDPSTPRVFVDESRGLSEIDHWWDFTIEVADPTKPVKVSLVWSDDPAMPSKKPTDPTLVNDLDLSVQRPDSTYRGNVFLEGWSVAGGKRDRLNNLENVFIQQSLADTYRVRVEASNLPGDGMLFRGDGTDQHFALVVSNANAVSAERGSERAVERARARAEIRADQASNPCVLASVERRPLPAGRSRAILPRHLRRSEPGLCLPHRVGPVPPSPDLAAARRPAPGSPQ